MTDLEFDLEACWRRNLTAGLAAATRAGCRVRVRAVWEDGRVWGWRWDLISTMPRRAELVAGVATLRFEQGLR